MRHHLACESCLDIDVDRSVLQMAVCYVLAQQMGNTNISNICAQYKATTLLWQWLYTLQLLQSHI